MFAGEVLPNKRAALTATSSTKRTKDGDISGELMFLWTDNVWQTVHKDMGKNEMDGK